MSTQLQKPNRVQTLALMLKDTNVKKRFEDMLKDRAPSFMSSILSVASTNSQLSQCEPTTVLSSAAIAASFNLPINPNLGFAYIIPYREKGVYRAQFQLGYKGIIQLAMRSGQYKNINADFLYEGQVKRRDRLRGLIEFEDDESKWNFETTVGYFAYFQTLNGMEKMVEMSVDSAKAHGKKYSKSFQKGSGPWATDFDSMALKTVIRKLLSKWGILTIDMQTHEAIRADQATDVTPEGEYVYPDAFIDAGTEIEETEKPKRQSKISKIMEESHVNAKTETETKAEAKADETQKA